MTFSRRHVLRLAMAVPIGLAVMPLAATYGRAMKSVAGQVRPQPSGTSASRCAVCGSDDHAMLDSTCPARRTVWRGRVG